MSWRNWCLHCSVDAHEFCDREGCECPCPTARSEFHPGDRVLLPSKIPGINRPLPAGAEGIVIEVPEEYEGRIVVVRAPNYPYDEWLPEGQGWSFHADTLRMAP